LRGCGIDGEHHGNGATGLVCGVRRGGMCGSGQLYGEREHECERDDIMDDERGREFCKCDGREPGIYVRGQ